MSDHTIGTREEWQAARDELAKLEAEHAELGAEGDRAAPPASLGAGGEGVRVRHRGRQEDARRALRRTLAAARLQHHVRARLRGRRLPGLLEPGGRARCHARASEPPRRDADLLLARADRSAHRLQAADGLAVPLRVDLRDGLPVRLRARDHARAGAADARGPGDGRRPARVARGLGPAGRSQAGGRPARGPELHRLRARERHASTTPTR